MKVRTATWTPEKVENGWMTPRQASSILAEYRSALADASVRRQAAEAAVAQSEARAALLENARDEAVAAHASPGRVPLSGETITAGGLRLILNREMDDVELAMAGFAARLICSATGITGDIEAEPRRKLLAEQEADRKSKPLALAPLGGDDAVAAANPLHAANPQPWEPPTAPRNPHVPGGLPPRGF